jgi:hypothetical protein
MNEIIPALIKDQEYVGLLEEIRATEAERSFAERMERVYIYHEIGCLIRDYQEAKNLPVTQFIYELHKDLKYAERSLWFAKECASKWRTKEELEQALPEGKATSWTKVKYLLGGGTEKTDDTVDLTKVAKGLIRRYGLENARVIAKEVLNTPNHV